METSSLTDQERRRAAGRNGDDEAGAADKLIPEWGVRADDQIIFVGVAVVLVLAALLLWGLLRDGDDGGLAGSAADLVPTTADGDSAAPLAGDEGEADATGDAAPTTTAAPTTSTTSEPASTTTTTAAAPVVGDVQAAVDGLPGAITGTAEGTVAVLDGFVANQAESSEAEAAAAAVEGVTEVTNNLVLLEPAVTEALTEAGVVGATAVGLGTEITVSGAIETEDDRGAVIAAAEAVDGVTTIVDDRLNVSVTADLNALPQVQFATASARILPGSFGDLDAAAELLTEAGDVRIEVQGYTSVEGDDAANLALSQNRAEAVRAYLIDAGVGDDMLTAVGFGETEQFGPDLASNRVVRFQQIGG